MSRIKVTAGMQEAGIIPHDLRAFQKGPTGKIQLFIGGGVGEAALMSTLLTGAGTGAVIGGGLSAIQGKDPLQGALMGALGGALTGGITSALGGAGSAAGETVAANAVEGALPSTGTTLASQNVANVVGDASLQNAAFNTGFTPASMTGNIQNAAFTPGTENLLQTAGTNATQGASPFVEGSNFVRTPSGGFSDMTSDIARATTPQGITAAPGAASAPTTTSNFTQQLADAGIKPQGFAPPGTAPGTVIGNNVVGANGMLYNNAQVAQFGQELQTGSNQGITGLMSKYKTPLMVGAGVTGLGMLMKQDQNKYGIPSDQDSYDGPLSKFKYDPSTYQAAPNPTPNVYRPVYAAEGGIMQLKKDTASPNPRMMQTGPANVDFMHGDMYPMSNIARSSYAVPTQMPTSAQAAVAGYEPQTNPMTGEPTAHLRSGGVAHYDVGGIAGYDYDPITGRFNEIPAEVRQQRMADAIALRNAQPFQQNQPTQFGMMDYAQNQNAAPTMDDRLQALGLTQSHMADYAYNPKTSTYVAMSELPEAPAQPQPDANAGFARGGIAQLAVGGKLLKGRGDGMSDSLRANIDGQREARLADGEFVVPADVVSHMGNGSTDAGAKQLYAMMNRVRKARTGNSKQGKQINPMKFMPA